ncbi:D-TA family PLP-dependent enzyme [Pedobacter hiemivivus]|uniref:D-TA family PLP-dependent enzyme n=1 Tax=Pedobacter hiemivivus TaxID=2530454 RepID=A0A4U1GI87_9SPHI|nr:D-TA family PLP-dependent enzyme [Pedobacter hiemivivus]TKC63941.1 D-TA family PLP-dependent enzyme [Pedobacter hiemivivus]
MTSVERPSERDWFKINNVNELDSPALVFYPNRIADNIKLLLNSIDTVNRLRPHVKTHKSAEVTTLMINAGITKFKCATIAEAEMLGRCGAADVLLAYQLVGPKINRYLSLVSAFPSTKFSSLVDNAYSLNELSQAAKHAGLEINVFLDLNLGMNRTGILPNENALTLYREMSVKEGIKAIGLHGYDGHIHDSSLAERKARWQLAWNSINNLKDQIIANGLPAPIIVAGGSPTYPFYAELTDVECSPGTFVLWDKGYHDACAEQKYAVAAVLITRVISLPDQTKVSLDLGHKSVAAENVLAKRVYFLNAPEAKIIGQSEEHLVLEMPKGHGLKIGDVLYGIPIHICPTVALYDFAATVEEHKVDGAWEIISRKRKINI